MSMNHSGKALSERNRKETGKSQISGSIQCSKQNYVGNLYADVDKAIVDFRLKQVDWLTEPKL